MAGPEPTAAQLRTLNLALSVTRALGAFDIGQAVAVRDGVVAAVEAVEGTDAAMRRAASLWAAAWSSPRPPNPGRICVSTGPRSDPRRSICSPEVGAAMIGIEAGRTMILERQRALELAQARQSRSTAMNELRAAVVGAGRLGTLHARKYAAIPGVKLSHVVDIDADARRANRQLATPAPPP